MPVIHQIDGIVQYWLPVYTQLLNIAATVFDGHVVCGRSVAVGELIALPGWWNARLDVQAVSSKTKAEDRFQSDAVQPSRRSRVPGPSAAASVRRSAVDIRRNDVRFHL